MRKPEVRNRKPEKGSGRQVVAALGALLLGTAGISHAQVAEQPAPPAETPKPDWMKYRVPYGGGTGAGEGGLSAAHRTLEEVGIWAQQAGADTLSFGPPAPLEKIEGFRKYFSSQGWKPYDDYLKKSTLLTMVAEQGYSVSTIVERTPEIVGHGVKEGAYHWILKMPVTVGLFSKDAAGNAKSGDSSKYVLFMDVMRTAEGGGDNGLAIFNWRLDPVR